MTLNTLNEINKGDITIDLDLLTPIKSQIRFGSRTKLSNIW